MPLPTVSFFIGAHQDDWQIFHGFQAWTDVRDGAKVVFIYLTAGDGGHPGDWWRAREAGALASCSLITAAFPSPEDRQEFNGRSIVRRVVGTTRSYFLRLPDGGYPGWGDGYPSQNHQSLWKLLKGTSTLKAVDGSASYEHWRELVETVESIVKSEESDSSSKHPWINTSDYLVGGLEGKQLDHCDHYATGELVRNFALGRYNALYWAGYDDPKRTKDVPEPDFRTKQSLMIRYSAAIRERYKHGDYEEAQEYYDGLMQKSYYRGESC